MRNALKSLVDRFRARAQDARESAAEIAAVRAAILAKETELSHAQNALLPRTEAVDRLHDVLVDWAARAKREHGLSVLQAIANPDRRPSLPGYREREIEMVAVILLGAVDLRDASQKFVASIPYEEGLPLDDRPAVVGRLQSELVQMKTEEEGFVDELNVLGFEMAHRPDVAERRAAEARRRELADSAAAERRRLEADIDSRRAPRRSA